MISLKPYLGVHEGRLCVVVPECLSEPGHVIARWFPIMGQHRGWSYPRLTRYMAQYAMNTPDVKQVARIGDVYVYRDARGHDHMVSANVVNVNMEEGFIARPNPSAEWDLTRGWITTSRKVRV